MSVVYVTYVASVDKGMQSFERIISSSIFTSYKLTFLMCLHTPKLHCTELCMRRMVPPNKCTLKCFLVSAGNIKKKKKKHKGLSGFSSTHKFMGSEHGNAVSN